MERTNLDAIKSITIILGGNSYHIATQGKVRKWLEAQNYKFYALGPGSSFTGFQVEFIDSNQFEQIQQFVSTLPAGASAAIEEI